MQMLTRQQLEDVARCGRISCKVCSANKGDYCAVSDEMSARTALSLMDKVEQKDEALRNAREAMKYGA